MIYIGKAQAPRPRNVILMIGDGMGVAQVSSRFYQNEETTNFTRFPFIGLINTSSATHKITDSAAGGTAYACGERTFNGGIGVNLQVQAIPNLPEIIARREVRTGVLATSSITHATPACFYAHASTRSAEEDIAGQLPLSKVDFFAGGGHRFFSGRADGQDYLRRLQDHGYVLDTTDLLPASRIETGRKYGFILAEEGMPRANAGRGDFLPRASRLAIDYLAAQREGFFLMIEGSQIDWGGHDNDAEYMLTETADFDRTIGEVLDFAEDDGQTLVVVTADHETGGVCLLAPDGDCERVNLSFSISDHSATLVPAFAYGPGAERFAGIYNNTDIFHRILALTGW